MKLYSRVQAAPHLDCWMQGDRYGRVVGFRKKFIQVRMFNGGHIREFSPENLSEVKA